MLTDLVEQNCNNKYNIFNYIKRIIFVVKVPKREEIEAH